jgi:hypothetical protein
MDVKMNGLFPIGTGKSTETTKNRPRIDLKREPQANPRAAVDAG